MKEFSYRAVDVETKEFIYGQHIKYKNLCASCEDDFEHYIIYKANESIARRKVDPKTISPKINESLHEGDVIRITTEQDYGDTNEWYVCSYIEEWATFGWINIYQYMLYQREGLAAINTNHILTTNQAENDGTLCGDIYLHRSVKQWIEWIEENLANPE